MCPKKQNEVSSFSSKSEQQITVVSGAPTQTSKPSNGWRRILAVTGVLGLIATIGGVAGKYANANQDKLSNQNNQPGLPPITNVTQSATQTASPAAPVTFSPTAAATTTKKPSNAPTKRKKKKTATPTAEPATLAPLASKAPTSALTQATQRPTIPPTRQPTLSDGYGINPRSEVLCYNIGTVYIDSYIDKTLPRNAQLYYERHGHTYQGEEIIYLEFWAKDPRTTARQDNIVESTIIPVSYVPLITNLPAINKNKLL